MPPPKCPEHNVEMVVKTAKKGRNAGGKFWGCPTWRTTRCKEIVPFTEGDVPETLAVPALKPTQHSRLPRSFSARTRFQGFNSRFFETVAVPESLLVNIIDSELPEKFQRAFSQWRIDHPPPPQIPEWTERERQALSVAEKILTRGRLTLCSPTLEKEYRNKFLANDVHANQSNLAEQILASTVRHSNFEFWLDSLAESIFFNEFLPSKLGPGIHRWVVPQVELTSLLLPNSASSISGRIDFLICHPSLEKPLIVEIDGAQHQSHSDKDETRDAALSLQGYRVLRIPSSEVEERGGVNLSALVDLLTIAQQSLDETPPHQESLNRFIHAIRVSHQIQIAIFQALQTGFLPLGDVSSWKLTVDLAHVSLFNQNESQFILRSATNDLLELIRTLGDLYSISICNGEPQLSTSSKASSLAISFSGQTDKSRATFFIQDISVPFHIANSVFTTSPAVLDKPSPKVLEYFLAYIFRKPSFWEGQVDAITRTLQGKDSIVLLPTGAGKSIAFQLASLLLPGRAIIVDPIIALMEDQLDNLRSVGIDRAVDITSLITDPQERTRILSLFGQGEYLFAYIAPERFQIVEFRDALRTLTTHTPISLIAVDEAHCISEWGHDFRTAYLNIGRTARKYCESNAITPPLLALTGTASRAVLKDIQRELQIEDFDAIITPKSFDRPEIRFHILRSSSQEKAARLLGYLGQTLPSKFSVSPAGFFQLNGKSTYSGLVFCPHVNGEFGVTEIAEKIKTSISVTTACYSGKEPKYYSKGGWESAKQAFARQFKQNQTALLVCTKAFGMGIDKPNIRFTIHYGIPSSIESFYQEAGRAGRDRKVAHCCILVSDDDPERTKKLLDPNTKAEQVREIIQAVSWDDNDDITRTLYFQTNAFPGISREKSSTAQVLQAFPNIAAKETRHVAFPNLKRHEAEKGLHRLLILGVVSDYTIDYGCDEFNVKLTGATKDSITNAYASYVAGYLEARRKVEVEKAGRLVSLSFSQFVIEMVDLLLHFIYDVIERGRRRALYEMYIAATVSPSDSSIRQRILHYLEATELSEVLEQILADSNGGLDQTKEAFETIRSANEAAQLRGQVARSLESYPDHPGLLMLRALAEMYCRDENAEVAKLNFWASVFSAESKYSVKDGPLFDFIVWTITKVSQRNLPLAQGLQANVFKKYPNRMLARGFVEHSPVTLATGAAWFLMNRLADNCRTLISS